MSNSIIQWHPRHTLVWAAAGVTLALGAALGLPTAGHDGPQYPIQVTISVSKPAWLEGEFPVLGVEYRNVTEQAVTAVLTGVRVRFFNAETGEDMGLEHVPCAIPPAPPPPPAAVTLQPGQVLHSDWLLYGGRTVGRWRVYCDTVQPPAQLVPPDLWPFGGYVTNEVVFQVVAVERAKLSVVAQLSPPEDSRPGSAIIAHAQFPGMLYSAVWPLPERLDLEPQSISQLATDADPSTLQAKWEKESGLSILYRHLTDPGLWTYDYGSGSRGYTVDFVVGPDDPLPVLRQYWSPGYGLQGGYYWAPYFKGYVYASRPDVTGYRRTRAWVLEEVALQGD